MSKLLPKGYLVVISIQKFRIEGYHSIFQMLDFVALTRGNPYGAVLNKSITTLPSQSSWVDCIRIISALLRPIEVKFNVFAIVHQYNLINEGIPQPVPLFGRGMCKSNSDQLEFTKRRMHGDR